MGDCICYCWNSALYSLAQSLETLVANASIVDFKKVIHLRSSHFGYCQPELFSTLPFAYP
jgi:hypothetical protein